MDFRDYEQFDAYDLIGDIHKKIPFQVNRTETFEEFKNSHFKILEIYRTGIDYYEIAMLGNDMSAKEVQERLNNLSLSINTHRFVSSFSSRFLSITFSSNLLSLCIKS